MGSPVCKTEIMTSLSSVSMGNQGHKRGRALDLCQELGEWHCPLLLLRTSPLAGPVSPSGKPYRWSLWVEGWLLYLGRRAPRVHGLRGPAGCLSSWTVSCGLSAPPLEAAHTLLGSLSNSLGAALSSHHFLKNSPPITLWG